MQHCQMKRFDGHALALVLPGEMLTVQNYVILTGISEQPDFRKGILKQGFKKYTGRIFIII